MGFVGHVRYREEKYINFFKYWIGVCFVGRLHLDSYVREEAGSTEEYIVKRLGGVNLALQFWDSETFFDLEREGLTGEGMIVRTSSDGQLDRCYRVDFAGRFDPVSFDAYPVEEGNFGFGEVFAKDNIRDGYTLEWSKFRGLFQAWYKLNKK